MFLLRMLWICSIISSMHVNEALTVTILANVLGIPSSFIWWKIFGFTEGMSIKTFHPSWEAGILVFANIFSIFFGALMQNLTNNKLDPVAKYKNGIFIFGLAATLASPFTEMILNGHLVSGFQALSALIVTAISMTMSSFIATAKGFRDGQTKIAIILLSMVNIATARQSLETNLDVTLAKFAEASIHFAEFIVILGYIIYLIRFFVSKRQKRYEEIPEDIVIW